VAIRSLVKHGLIRIQDKKYDNRLAAKKLTYMEWITQQEERQGSMPDKQKRDQVDFLCAVDSHGELAEHALEWINDFFSEHPKVDVLYGDEDVWENGVRRSPWFKPDWSPDLMRESYYFGSVTAVRKEFLEREGIPLPEALEDPAGQMIRYSDQKIYAAWGRTLAESAGGYLRGSDRIGHIPQILFHGYSERVYENYLNDKDATGWEAGERDIPLISVIIPSKDHPQLLESCLEHLNEAMGSLSYEVILIDNGSNEINQKRTEVLAKAWREKGVEVQYDHEPMDFHFSRMCNLGAARSKGQLLFFLNDDVELGVQSGLGKMAQAAQNSYTGAVGLKLYYPDSVRIQHAGIVNLPMGPVHKLQFLEDDQEFYCGVNKKSVNVIAVTGACLMVEREKFKAAGGFSENLPIAFNDVDLCFRLYEAGYFNVCVNSCFGYHHESLSRGEDESVEKLNRLLTERDALYENHPGMEGKDPFYSQGLGRDGLDTRIRPAWETGANSLQQEQDIQPALKETAGVRKDPCVMVRVESLREGILQGFCVVLGDDNACYEKRILLTDEDGKSFALPVEEQYRPDLVENMRDQMNVGLSGFWMDLSLLKDKSILPRGIYRIGMIVRNRVNGLRLYNNSNRYFTV